MRTVPQEFDLANGIALGFSVALIAIRNQRTLVTVRRLLREWVGRAD